MTAGFAPENLRRVARMLGCNPSQLSMIPALTISSLNLPIAASSSVVGMTPASASLFALTITIKRIVASAPCCSMIREPHDRDRRKPCLGRAPAVAAILGNPQPAAGRAEGEPFAARIDRQRVPPHQIVGVALRQPVAQYLETLAAVASARDDHLAVDRDAALVFDGRDKPRGVRIARMRHDGKAEFRRTNGGNLTPAMAGILGPEDAVM